MKTRIPSTLLVFEGERARFTGHTSFKDPASPPDAPPRESIEVRALLFFAPAKK